MPSSSATALSVTAYGPRSIKSLRATKIASPLASSAERRRRGGGRRRLVDMRVSSPVRFKSLPQDHALLAETQTPADLTIHPRDLAFGRTSPPPRWWLGGDPIATAFF